jgi:hypothetical protein
MANANPDGKTRAQIEFGEPREGDCYGNRLLDFLRRTLRITVDLPKSLADICITNIVGNLLRQDDEGCLYVVYNDPIIECIDLAAPDPPVDTLATATIPGAAFGVDLNTAYVSNINITPAANFSKGGNSYTINSSGNLEIPITHDGALNVCVTIIRPQQTTT